ncbi:hypothetical protein RHGRI_028886 [Rhododendron griersonianum]|uniref:BED-type domain-containing protein n=1 Tax=Rhododendron griersonianum TaxID=479676 RepID=A0AAV6IHW4_9ERIC|nr:hypothetical protein RHGRI_028886 [Rhododendron griersonianum]
MANDGNADVNQPSIQVGTEGNDKQAEDPEVIHEEERNPFEKKARKKTSHVWDDFDTVTSKKSRCKFCKQTYCSQVSGPTIQLIRHLKNCVQRKLALGNVEKKQKTLSFETIESDSVNLTTFKYDHVKVREAASHMLIYHEWITVDNASYNDLALKILQGTFKLLKKKLLFGSKLFHVRCCAHILNLMVQDGLSVIGGVIECVREAVKYLVASEPHLIQFSEIAKQLQLPSKRLILDCPTRWNSAYLMLSAALEFKDVFPRYSERDLGFAYVPSYEEWEKVEKVCQFLEIFNDVTNIISGSEYPTSNLFLTEVWRIKEILDKSTEDCDDCIRLMAIRMKLKFDKYWGESNLLMGLGKILDPRYKMVLPGFCFPVIYYDPLPKVSQLKDSLYELYNEYVAMHSQA